MKKFFSIAAVAALVVLGTSCNKEELKNAAEGEVNVTLSVATPSVMGTKAFSTGNGANKLVYAIYPKGTNVPVKTETFTDFNMSRVITVALVAGKEYDFIFWAQDEDATCYTYNEAAKNITVTYGDATTPVAGNDETRDAFFAGFTTKITNQTQLDVDLKRPFSQVNVATTDLAVAEAAGFDTATAMITVTTEAYTGFNLLDGEVEGNLTEAYFAPTAFCSTETFPMETTGVTYTYLSMDYILMAADKELVSVDLVIADEAGTENPIELVNVPVQRNYRTNIYGALLTNPLDIVVEIKPNYIEDNEYDIYVPGSYKGSITSGQDKVALGVENLGNEAGNFLDFRASGIAETITLYGGEINGTGVGPNNFNLQTYVPAGYTGTVIFEGVTFDVPEINPNSPSGADWAMTMLTSGGDVQFKNCTFTGKQTVAYISDGAAKVTFDSCTFAVTTQAIQAECDFNLANLVITNCDFSATVEVLHVWDTKGTAGVTDQDLLDLLTNGNNVFGNDPLVVKATNR